MNKEITKSRFDGYLWLSDQTEPSLVLHNEEFSMTIQDGVVSVLNNQIQLEPGQFVVEAMLYDVEQQVSYSVRYVDGEYLIAEFKVNPLDFNRDNVQIVSYMGSYKSLEGLDHLQFLKYWKEEPDQLCEGMAVLQPQAFVFVGFVNKYGGLNYADISTL